MKTLLTTAAAILTLTANLALAKECSNITKDDL